MADHSSILPKLGSTATTTVMTCLTGYLILAVAPTKDCSSYLVRFAFPRRVAQDASLTLSSLRARRLARLQRLQVRTDQRLHHGRRVRRMFVISDFTFFHFADLFSYLQTSSLPSTSSIAREKMVRPR